MVGKKVQQIVVKEVTVGSSEQTPLLSVVKAGWAALCGETPTFTASAFASLLPSGPVLTCILDFKLRISFPYTVFK